MNKVQAFHGNPSDNHGSSMVAVWRIVKELPVGAAPNVPVFGENPEAISFSAKFAHDIIRRGISSRAIKPLSDYLGKGAAADFLDIDRATAARWASKDESLPTHVAENVLHLLELYSMASDAFETADESGKWLRTPHPMLEGSSPIEAAKTSYGTERVKEILTAIKYGGVV